MILTLATYNLLGGRGLFFGRVLFRMVIMPAIVLSHVGFSWHNAVVVFAGFALWASFGWGKYFASFHGRYDPNEKEIAWIDWVGKKVFPYDGEKLTNHFRGILCMGLRGLYLYPMFVLIGYPLLGLLMFLQGAIYGICSYVKEQHAVPCAEFLTGALISVVLL